MKHIPKYCRTKIKILEILTKTVISSSKNSNYKKQEIGIATYLGYIDYKWIARYINLYATILHKLLELSRSHVAHKHACDLSSHTAHKYNCDLKYAC